MEFRVVWFTCSHCRLKQSIHITAESPNQEYKSTTVIKTTCAFCKKEVEIVEEAAQS